MGTFVSSLGPLFSSLRALCNNGKKYIIKKIMFVNGDKSLITLLDSFPLTHLIQLEKQATVTVCNGLDNIELKVGLSLFIQTSKTVYHI